MDYINNKQINKIKLAITTKCNFACPYCFVKTKDSDMPWSVAKKSVDLLIDSLGNEKLLSLYGGEPLLKFDLIKKIVKYAKIRAKEKNKGLIISICTNASLIDQKKLDFFKKNDVRIIFSLAGSKEVHNQKRVLKNGAGTYEVFKKSVKKLKKTILKKNYGLSLCVFPEHVDDLSQDVKKGKEMGFDYFNLEIIRENIIWDKKAITSFKKEMVKLAKRVIKSIDEGDFLYLNKINWKIKYGLIKNEKRCHFNYELEIYPNGDMTTSPFILNLENYKKYLIANINGKATLFKKCVFKENNSKCINCRKKYISNFSLDDNAQKAINHYETVSLALARYILKKSKTNKKYKRYVQKIKKEICF